MQIGTEIGELVEAKNAAYGSSFAKAGEFLGLLYPNGILPEQFADALLLVRIFDKQMRIATDRDALGESPYRDIAGYGILGASLHEPRSQKERPDVGRESPLQTRVPVARMRKTGEAKQGQVLQRQLPHEGLSRGQRKKAANVPALPQKSEKTRASARSRLTRPSKSSY